MTLKARIGIMLLFAVMAMSPASASAATVSELSRDFICQCGCNAVLDNCTHAECAVRETMLGLISQGLDQGQSGAGITQFLVSRYGEEVLSSPPKRGFNLMSWITPFAAILGGGVIIYALLRKWVGRGNLQASPRAAADGRDTEYERRLEKELDDFNERGFR